MSQKITFIPVIEVDKIKNNVFDKIIQAEILADVFRLNTLSMITKAGSGHIGSSFSCMDLATWLWLFGMENPNQPDKECSDTFFSSKGHDAPGLYSILIGLKYLNEDLLLKLRRLNGLPGHPDIHTPYIAANTGSLGMGIAKARGMAIANRLNGKKGKFYVVTGDGELQEGQIWESLQPTANGKFGEITVIVDHNKIQSDTWVKDVSDLGDLEKRFAAHGWAVKSCDGNNIREVAECLEGFKKITDKPQVLIANTIKGAGVSFMNHQFSKAELYQFHSGAPSYDVYQQAVTELKERIDKKLDQFGVRVSSSTEVDYIPKPILDKPQKLVTAFGDELIALGRENENIVVLDADLVLDTGLIPFQKVFPQRFIECGIAEQDMVSTASGLALRGKLPIVNSFACFLSTRPNEQIYNNSTEKTKIIYVGSLAGLLPAGPGHSHQSVRDISILGSIPDLVMIQPANEIESRLAIRWAVAKNDFSTYIRLVTVPSVTSYQLPDSYELVKGQGTKIHTGSDVALVSYGPTMLVQSYKAAEILKEKNISVAVYNLPWLNYLDQSWVVNEFLSYKKVFSINDHYSKFSQGSALAEIFSGIKKMPPLQILGLIDIPECGTNDEVLIKHGLDADSIVGRVLSDLDELK